MTPEELPKFQNPRLAKLVRAIIAWRPLAGEGMSADEGSDGIRLSTASPGHLFDPDLLGGDRPLKLSKVDDTHIRVTQGTIGGLLPTDMVLGDDPPFVLAVSGSGVVYGALTINGSTGARISCVIESGASLPDDSATVWHVPIGTFATASGSLTVATVCNGSIAAQICRNWFSAEAPFFGVSFA